MSNIKLKNHNWDTIGVYDSTLGKSQKEINAEIRGLVGAFPPSYVIIDKITATNGALSNNTSYCTTRPFSFSDYVEVSLPSGVSATVINISDGNEITGSPLIIPPYKECAINFTKNGGTFNRSDFNSIIFKSSKNCWNVFNDDFVKHVNKTSRLESYGAAPATAYKRSFGYNILQTGDRAGFIKNTGSGTNCVSKLLVADVDLILISSVDTILDINGSIINVPKGVLYEIAKDTQFIVSSSSRSRDILFLSKYKAPADHEIGNQLINSSLSIRCDSAFILDSKKIVMIAKDTGNFNVIKDGSIIQTGSLGTNVGHANSCNYIPETNMLYVSTWNDGKTIACYSVADGDTVTFNFVKNIVITNATCAACNYFIADKNEKEIIGLGWKYTYNKPTNESQNALDVAIYTKVNGDYVISKQFTAFAPGELQGMTFNAKENCIYYLAGAVTGYNHTGINAITLNGHSYVALPAAGSIGNNETEAIFPINEEGDAYMVVDSNGHIYICSINE